MKAHRTKQFSWLLASFLLLLALSRDEALAAEKLTGIQSAHALSLSMPWIAHEAGLFRKHNLDFQLVYIPSSPVVTAALLAGDAEVALVGAVGIIRAFVQGATDLVFIGATKNTLTHSILAKPEIKKVEDLRGKKVGVTRFGTNPHYFAVQALRRFGLEPGRDFAFIQTGGSPETLAALINEGIDAAVLVPPLDAQASALRYHYVVYGPDLRIPYVATAIATRRSMIARRPQVVREFTQVMAEATKILLTDREFTFKVLGRELRIKDRKVFDAAYKPESTVLDRRLDIRPEALQAILDEVSQTDPRAKRVKPEDLVDRRYLEEMEKSGFFDRLWASKG